MTVTQGSTPSVKCGQESDTIYKQTRCSAGHGNTRNGATTFKSVDLVCFYMVKLVPPLLSGSNP